MERVRRSWRLMGQSAQVLRQSPHLLVLVLAGLVGFVLVAGGLFLAVHGRFPTGSDFRGARFLQVFPLMIVGGIVPTFTNAAVVAVAIERLSGREPSLRDGLRTAWRRFPQLLAWTLVNGLVSFGLQTIAERLKIAGPIARVAIGLTWSLATYFVVPVLLFEPVGVADAVRRSAHIFKERWGEGASALGSIGATIVVVSIPVSLIGGVLVAVAPVAGVVWFVSTIAILFVLTGALGTIYTGALYRYAIGSGTSGPFTEQDLAQAFGPKRRTHRRR